MQGPRSVGDRLWLAWLVAVTIATTTIGLLAIL